MLLLLTEVLHGVLLEKGAAVAVLEGVREFLHDFSRDELSVEYGCRALVALLMQKFVLSLPLSPSLYVCVCLYVM